MKTETVNAIKAEMKYTEAAVPTCSKCKHSVEREDKYVDRMWDRFCQHNPLGEFSVKDGGRCAHFENKEM